jgi:hypothetical protein
VLQLISLYAFYKLTASFGDQVYRHRQNKDNPFNNLLIIEGMPIRFKPLDITPMINAPTTVPPIVPTLIWLINKYNAC